MREAERIVMLNVIDNQWKDHLLSMDHLKEGIGLRGYGQKDPLIEYKKESFELFQDMMDRIEDETIRYLFFLQVTSPAARSGRLRRSSGAKPAAILEDDDGEETKNDDEDGRRAGANAEQRRAAQNVGRRSSRAISSARKTRKWPSCNSSAAGGINHRERSKPSPKKAGRNDPCPCGSGKKYKKCHGA